MNSSRFLYCCLPPGYSSKLKLYVSSDTLWSKPDRVNTRPVLYHACLPPDLSSISDRLTSR